jgi:hypothetical protein
MRSPSFGGSARSSRSRSRSRTPSPKPLSGRTCPTTGLGSLKRSPPAPVLHRVGGRSCLIKQLRQSRQLTGSLRRSRRTAPPRRRR